MKIALVCVAIYFMAVAVAVLFEMAARETPFMW